MLKVISRLFQCLAILKGIFGNCVKPVRIFRWWQAPHLEIPESQVLLKLPSAVTVAGWWSHDFAQVTQPMNDDTHDISWVYFRMRFAATAVHGCIATDTRHTRWQVGLGSQPCRWTCRCDGRYDLSWRRVRLHVLQRREDKPWQASTWARLYASCAPAEKAEKPVKKKPRRFWDSSVQKRQSNNLWSFTEVITMQWFVVFCINPCSAARKPPRRLNCFASESFVESLMISNGFSSFIAQDSVVSTGDVFLRPIFFAFRPASVMRSASAQIVGSQTSQTAESGEFGPILELTQVYQIFPNRKNRKNRKNISSWVCLCVSCPVTLLTLAPFQRLTTISSSKRRVWFLELSHTIEIYWVTVAFLIHMTNLNCFSWVLHEARRFRAFLLRLGSRKVPRCPQTAFCIGFNWLILKWLQNTLPVIMGGASRNGSVGGSSVFSSDEKFLKRVRLQMNEKPKKLKPFGIKMYQACSFRFWQSFNPQGWCSSRSKDMAPCRSVMICHGQFWNTWKGIEGGQYSCVHIKKDYRSIVAKHAQTSENSWNSWLWSIIIYLGFVL